MVVEVAGCLADYGYDVRVLYDGPACEHRGATYLPRDFYEGEDIVLAVNSVPPHLPATNAYWTSLVHDRDHQFQEFQHRIVLSPYHQSVFGPDSTVIPLACWPEKFKGGTKKKGLCLYSSSPDRGGEFLLDIWPEVVKEVPETDLVCTYSKDISESQMEELYKEADYWLHPCLGTELFCISGYKAVCARCVPVFVPAQALDTTIKKGLGVRTTVESFKDDLIEALKNPPYMPNSTPPSWYEVTDQILTLWGEPKGVVL